MIGVFAAGALFLSVALNSPPVAQALKPKEYYDQIYSKAKKQCPDGLDPLRSDLIDEPPRIVCLATPGPGVRTRPARHWHGFPGYTVVAYEIAISDGQLGDIAVSPAGSVFLAAGHTVVVKVDRGRASVVHKPYDAPISFVAGTCVACWFAVGQGDRARLGWFAPPSTASHTIRVASVPDQQVGSQGDVWPDPSDAHQRNGIVWFIEWQGRAVGRYARGGITIVSLFPYAPNGVVPLSGSVAAVPISCLDCILMVQNNRWWLRRLSFGDRVNSIVPVGSRYWFLGDHAVGAGSLQTIHRVWNLAPLRPLLGAQAPDGSFWLIATNPSVEGEYEVVRLKPNGGEQIMRSPVSLEGSRIAVDNHGNVWISAEDPSKMLFELKPGA